MPLGAPLNTSSAGASCCPQSCPQGLCWLPSAEPLTNLALFQMDVDEETAEKFYQKLLELEEQALERYGDLLD